MSVRTKRRESGSYAVYRHGVEVGEIVREGPNSPQSPWVGRLGEWEVRGEQKQVVKDALVAHLIAQNGYIPAETTPPPVAATTVLPGLGDQERFTYLAWHEVKDRLALTRGLVSDILARGDIYAATEEQYRLLHSIEISLTSAHQAMRRHDGEGF